MHPRPSQDTRQQRTPLVHDAVRALLAERGMRLSMEAVAARAGCSKQTLYAHYGNKRNLLREVMQAHVALTTARLADDGQDLRGGLQAFALDYLDQLNRPDVVHSARLIAAESHRFPEEARQIYRDGIASLQQRLAEWLQRAIARGQLRHDDPHSMAELLLGMIVGMDFDRQRLQTPHRRTPGARRKWAEFAIDSFLRAFATTAPASN